MIVRQSDIESYRLKCKAKPFFVIKLSATKLPPKIKFFTKNNRHGTISSYRIIRAITLRVENKLLKFDGNFLLKQNPNLNPSSSFQNSQFRRLLKVYQTRKN